MTDTARAVADLAEGMILASVEVPAAPERAFAALASAAITDWWVRPGVFDTREWTGDVRPGGRWRAAGRGGGRPYVLEGEFLQVDAPTALVHTWHPGGQPAAVTTVSYRVAPAGAGSRITLRHTGFRSRETCLATCIGWETSFQRLTALLGA